MESTPSLAPRQHERIDPELGRVRRCRRCLEWWPLEAEFYAVNNRTPGRRLLTCHACRAEGRPVGKPIEVRTDLRRARALRTSRAWNARHAEVMRERTRAWKAAFRAEFRAVVEQRPRVSA